MRQLNSSRRNSSWSREQCLSWASTSCSAAVGIAWNSQYILGIFDFFLKFLFLDMVFLANWARFHFILLLILLNFFLSLGIYDFFWYATCTDLCILVQNSLGHWQIKNKSVCIYKYSFFPFTFYSGVFPIFPMHFLWNFDFSVSSEVRWHWNIMATFCLTI